jgi:hypothetical protein
MSRIAEDEKLIGRRDELRRLRVAIQKRESRLLWGAADSGKTALLETVIAELTEEERGTCILWTGAMSIRQLLSHSVGRLYKVGNSFVQKKVREDRDKEPSVNGWLSKQSSLRLRGILLAALAQAECRIFVDHVPPATRNLAGLMKQIMYRSRTPIYLAARSCSPDEVGEAWSLYWHDGLRLFVGPLAERDASVLLEACVRKFSLVSLDLEQFRQDVLNLSGHLPGSIVKMCQLAADSRYRQGDQFKINLVYLDYLIRSNPLAPPEPTKSLL